MWESRFGSQLRVRRMRFLRKKIKQIIRYVIDANHMCGLRCMEKKTISFVYSSKSAGGVYGLDPLDGHLIFLVHLISHRIRERKNIGSLLVFPT